MQKTPFIADIIGQRRISGPPRRFQDALLITLFLLPALIIFLIFVIYPIFR
jgi:hypothetical protein